MDDQEAIESAIARFIEAYNSGDLENVLAYYDGDLVKLRHGAGAESKYEIAERLVEVFRDFKTRVSVRNEELQVAGEVAFTRGSYQVTLEPRGEGEPQVIHRRYLEIWRRRDGRWMVYRSMDNQ